MDLYKAQVDKNQFEPEKGFSVTRLFDDAYNKGIVQSIKENPKEAATTAAAVAVSALAITKGGALSAVARTVFKDGAETLPAWRMAPGAEAGFKYVTPRTDLLLAEIKNAGKSDALKSPLSKSLDGLADGAAKGAQASLSESAMVAKYAGARASATDAKAIKKISQYLDLKPGMEGKLRAAGVLEAPQPLSDTVKGVSRYMQGSYKWHY